MQLLNDRYRLGESLGTGGTAQVFEAEDTLLGARRAIKLITRDGPGGRLLRKRLRAEARAMARLDQVFHCGSAYG